MTTTHFSPDDDARDDEDLNIHHIYYYYYHHTGIDCSRAEQSAEEPKPAPPLHTDKPKRCSGANLATPLHITPAVKRCREPLMWFVQDPPGPGCSLVPSALLVKLSIQPLNLSLALHERSRNLVRTLVRPSRALGPIQALEPERVHHCAPDSAHPNCLLHSLMRHCPRRAACMSGFHVRHGAIQAPLERMAPWKLSHTFRPATSIRVSNGHSRQRTTNVQAPPME